MKRTNLSFVFQRAFKLQQLFNQGCELVSFELLAKEQDPAAWQQMGPTQKRGAIADIKRHMVAIRDMAHKNKRFISLVNATLRSNPKGKLLNPPATVDDALKSTQFKCGLPIVAFASPNALMPNGWLRAADGSTRMKNASHIANKHEAQLMDAIEAGYMLPETFKQFLLREPTLALPPTDVEAKFKESTVN